MLRKFATPLSCHINWFVSYLVMFLVIFARLIISLSFHVLILIDVSVMNRNQFFLTVGLVLINALGIPGINNKSWWAIIMASTLIPVVIMAFGMVMVGLETPGWLLAHEQPEQACK